MSFLSSVTEIFKGRKPEVSSPQPNLNELKQHEQSLSKMMQEGGKDFKNPADANTLREVRNKIAAFENQQAPTPPETTSPQDLGITQIPGEAPQETVEETKAA